MFLRLEAFYQTQYGSAGAVRLTHSQALVVEPDLRKRVALSPDSDSGDRDGRSRLVRAKSHRDRSTCEASHGSR